MSNLTLTIDDVRALQNFVGRLRDEMARTAIATEGINNGRGAQSGIVIEGVASGTPVPVSGTVTASGAATQTTLAALLAQQGEALQADTFTGTGGGLSLSLVGYAAKYYTLSVFPTGAVTSWDVRMEVSIDGLAWVEVAAHTNAAPGASIPVFSSTPKLARVARARCAAVVLGGGTNIITSIVASR